jgi:hypothetical protein
VSFNAVLVVQQTVLRVSVLKANGHSIPAECFVTWFHLPGAEFGSPLTAEGLMRPKVRGTDFGYVVFNCVESFIVIRFTPSVHCVQCSRYSFVEYEQISWHLRKV